MYMFLDIPCNGPRHLFQKSTLKIGGGLNSSTLSCFSRQKNGMRHTTCVLRNGVHPPPLSAPFPLHLSTPFIPHSQLPCADAA